MRRTDAGVQRSNRNGWHSKDDFFLRTEPGCSALRGHIVDAVKTASLQVSPKLDFSQWLIEVEGWINISGQGAYNAPHDHPGFVWSGVYYVSTPAVAVPGSGDIEFIDPRTNARVPTIQGADCFADKKQITPEPGTLLLFPAYLRHWVHPNSCAADRVSVAFNARLKPRVTYT
ncbi:MAG: 2OG-Fe(II) oxygenase family protein [Beijerinckiaceae bacterium]|nr:2OG-Fe(II) oxygenase family protein [Beijerinckiaceae bacterium]